LGQRGSERVGTSDEGGGNKGGGTVLGLSKNVGQSLAVGERNPQGERT